MNAPKFIITGLPRSRTAWLANFMTTGGVLCHHEGIHECDSWAEYGEKVNRCGDSGSWFGLLDNVNEAFPGVPVVVIHGSIGRGMEFMRDRGMEPDYFTLKAIEDRLEIVSGLHVQQYDVNNSLADIWKHCMNDVGIPWDFHRRAAMLQDLNVQVRDDVRYDGSRVMGLINETRS